jgi:uncharacterized protein YqjF (DUF2071 family)
VSARAATAGDYPVACPHPVQRFTMAHEWRSLAFVHWAYDPAAVRPLLAPGLELDTWDGAAWVGLVPFRLRIRHRGTPFVPWACSFLETNVRTYVRGPDARAGIWFLSLDAARLGAVLVARGLWRLPYRWASMRMSVDGDTIAYRSRRFPAGPTSDVVIRAGVPVDPGEQTGLERFLTARYDLWSVTRRGLARTEADHTPWMLRRSTLVRADPGLLVAAGLPRPRGDAVAHVAGDVAVRLGPRTGAVER